MKLFQFKDPDTLEIKYIGATTGSLNLITSQYICASNACGRPLCKWLGDLTRSGKRPIVEEVKEIDSFKERNEYIEKIRRNNSKILNVDKKESEIYINAGKCNAGNKRASRGKTTDEKNKSKLISSLINFYEKYDRFPEIKFNKTKWGEDNDKCDELKMLGPTSYIRVFGSYKEARNIAYRKITGDETAEYKQDREYRKPEYTKEEMIKFCVDFKIKNGYYPKICGKTRKWNDNFLDGIYGLSQQNYYKIFGDLTKLRELCDKYIMEQNERNNNK